MHIILCTHTTHTSHNPMASTMTGITSSGWLDSAKVTLLESGETWVLPQNGLEPRCPSSMACKPAFSLHIVFGMDSFHPLYLRRMIRDTQTP